MTGINSIQTQTPSFLTTLQATLDILDDVSGAMPENTYLTLTNNLQELYNMHTSNSNSTSTSTSNSYANRPITTSINYTRSDYISDISYASISNFDISNDISNISYNSYISNISDISYASLSNFDISNANTANTNANTANANANNTNNIINNENINIQSLNEESNRIGYSTRTRLALYNNVFNA